MKISIITATKNNKDGLLRAIESVRSQSYKNVEHIIVDGLSTDGTAELLRTEIRNQKPDLCLPTEGQDRDRNDKAQSDILRQAQDDNGLTTDNFKTKTNSYELRAISEADSGIYDAINKGIKLATGDVIGLLHSDDTLANDEVLTKIAYAFEQYNIESLYGDLVYTTASGKIIRMWKSGHCTAGKIIDGWMPPHPTLFVKKEIFEKFGFYRTDMKIAADYEMVLRLFYKHKITTHYLPVTTYCMTIGGASNKSLKNIFIKSSEDYRAMKMHGIPFPLKTLFLKNIRKLPQFFRK